LDLQWTDHLSHLFPLHHLIYDLNLKWLHQLEVVDLQRVPPKVHAWNLLQIWHYSQWKKNCKRVRQPITLCTFMTPKKYRILTLRLKIPLLLCWYVFPSMRSKNLEMFYFWFLAFPSLEKSNILQIFMRKSVLYVGYTINSFIP